VQDNQPEAAETRETSSRKRRFSGLPGKLINAVSALIVLYTLLNVSGLLLEVGFYVFGPIHQALIFTFVMVMVYLHSPATSQAPTDRLPWYDLIAIAVSLVVGIYLMVNAKALQAEQMPANPLQQVLALAMVVLVMEAARRTVGWIYSLIGLFFFTYPFYAHVLPGVLKGGNFSLQRVTTMVLLSPDSGMLGDLMRLFSFIIIVFITFGVFLQLSGAGKFFLDLSMALVGRYRGGPAKVAVLASAMFGSMSAGAAANVATTGAITIPLMKSIGYKPHFAAAVEATASTGGHMMPPVMATMAFIIADFLGVRYIDVAFAALIPAILYYMALLVMVDLEAGKTGIAGMPSETLPSLKESLTGGWFYAVPIVVMLYAMIELNYYASTAGVIAIVSMVLVSFLGKRENWMTPTRIWDGLARGGHGGLTVGCALAVAGALTSSLALTGVGIRLTGLLVELAGGSSLLLLAVTTIIVLIMGMAVGPTAVYMTVALLVVPAMLAAGIEPMAAHMFLLFLCSAALITPPICMSSFVAAQIAGANFMRTGWTGMRLGIVAFVVPFVFVYSPELIMIGPPTKIIVATFTAAIGVFMLSAGLAGYLLGSLGVVTRVVLLLAGGVMIVPGWMTDMVGAAIGLGILLWQRNRSAVNPTAGMETDHAL
jgi:TRAP transporter 4TM/12TM fusion protein